MKFISTFFIFAFFFANFLQLFSMNPVDSALRPSTRSFAVLPKSAPKQSIYDKSEDNQSNASQQAGMEDNATLNERLKDALSDPEMAAAVEAAVKDHEPLLNYYVDYVTDLDSITDVNWEAMVNSPTPTEQDEALKRASEIIRVEDKDLKLYNATDVPQMQNIDTNPDERDPKISKTDGINWKILIVIGIACTVTLMILMLGTIWIRSCQQHQSAAILRRNIEEQYPEQAAMMKAGANGESFRVPSMLSSKPGKSNRYAETTTTRTMKTNSATDCRPFSPNSLRKFGNLSEKPKVSARSGLPARSNRSLRPADHRTISLTARSNPRLVSSSSSSSSSSSYTYSSVSPMIDNDLKSQKSTNANDH